MESNPTTTSSSSTVYAADKKAYNTMLKEIARVDTIASQVQPFYEPLKGIDFAYLRPKSNTK